MQFSFGNAFSQGWGAVRGRYIVLLEASVLYTIGQVVSVIAQLLLDGDEAGWSARGLLTQAVISIGIAIPTGAGFIWMGALAQREGPVPVMTFFAGYRRLASLVRVWLLQAAALFAAMLPALGMTFLLVADLAFDLGLNTNAIQGGALGRAVLFSSWFLCAGLAIWLSARLVFAQLVCLDPDAPETGAVACLAESWHRTRGSALPLSLMLIAIGLATALSILLFGIGLLLLGMPFSIGVLGAAYHQLITTQRSGAAEPLGSPVSPNPGL